MNECCIFKGLLLSIGSFLPWLQICVFHLLVPSSFAFYLVWVCMALEFVIFSKSTASFIFTKYSLSLIMFCLCDQYSCISFLVASVCRMYLFHSLTFNLYLRCIFCKPFVVEFYFFIQSDNFDLLIGIFHPFTF